jgi:hypothetical protein
MHKYYDFPDGSDSLQIIMIDRVFCEKIILEHNIVINNKNTDLLCDRY